MPVETSHELVIIIIIMTDMQFHDGYQENAIIRHSILDYVIAPVQIIHWVCCHCINRFEGSLELIILTLSQCNFDPFIKGVRWQ